MSNLLKAGGARPSGVLTVGTDRPSPSRSEFPLSQTLAQRLDMLDEVLTENVDHGVFQRIADDHQLDGRTIAIDGRELVNFGSCSYLGLETDERLKEAAVEATRRWGTQFSTSRSYVSAPPYAALEAMLEELFGGAVMIAPTTSLGHLSTLPIVVDEHDAVVLDHQVHHSVQVAANQLRVQGTHVELVRHNRMDLLEERIQVLGKTHPRVWYMADGVYSMFADTIPLADMQRLMDTHEQFHLFVDDSHGMSWAGKHGRGFVLGHMPIRDRMIVAASLNKAFAAAGGAFVFADADLRRRVQLLPGPMMFSGPIQPPLLGAALASAQIHLSPEIEQRQALLRDRVQLTNVLLQEFELPLVAPSEAPIRYVGAGIPRMSYKVAQRMMDDGYWVNMAPYPAVPMKKTGIRTPITVHHSLEDIHGMVESLARHLPVVLAEEGSSIAEVEQTFGLAAPRRRAAAARSRDSDLRLEHHTSIDQVDAAEWDALLGDRGTFTAEGLRFIEEVFGAGSRPEDSWTFHYYVVRESAGAPVLATFFTEALWKDDMLARAEVSRRVEEMRADDRYLLTSRTLSMGSLLSEGDHLWIDRAADWRGALGLVLDAVAAEQRASGADNVVLRDFAEGDTELDAFMRDQGFARAPMLDSYVLDRDFDTDDEMLARLSSKSRYHQRREVLPWEHQYEVEVIRHGGRRLTRPELERIHRLYLNTEERGLDLNSFDLPIEVFERMQDFPSWELVLSYLKPEFGGPEERLPVAFGAHFVGREHYSPLIVGLDYGYVRPHRAYRVALLTMLRCAAAHGLRQVYMGMGAPLEKHRFGARAQKRFAYVQASDHFAMEVLAAIEADAGAEGRLVR